MSEDEPYQFQKEIKPAIGATKKICTFILKIENGAKTNISKKVLSHLNTKYAIPVRCWE